MKAWLASTHGRVMLFLLCLIALAVGFGPALLHQVGFAANPLNLNDDARQQIWPFLQYRDSTLFANDFIADYQFGFNPVGFQLLYALPARFIDPRLLSKVVPFVLLAAFLGLIWRSARITGGTVAAWLSVALALSAEVFVLNMGGGLPRAFGFPLAAGLALALVNGKPLQVAVVTLLGALFYFPIAVVGGISLAFLLLILPSAAGERGDWGWRRRAMFLGGTALLVAAAVAPNVVRTRTFGPPIAPAQHAQFPEAGRNGRFTDENVVGGFPLSRIGLDAIGSFAYAIDGGENVFHATAAEVGRRYRRPILALTLLVGLLGGILLLGESASVRRLSVLPAAGIAAYVLSWLAVPYLYIPERYLRFTIPVVVVSLLPLCFEVVADRVLSRLASGAAIRRAAKAATVASVALLLVLLGGRGRNDAGLSVTIDATETPLHDYLRTLPPDVVIAGWPTSLNNIQYGAERTALITFETHLAFHQKYVLEMRARMRAVIAAFTDSGPRSLIVLRDQFGVTHLVIDRRQIELGLTYFAPFDTAITSATQSAGASQSFAASLPESALSYSDQYYSVVDLRRLALVPSG